MVTGRGKSYCRFLPMKFKDIAFIFADTVGEGRIFL